MKKKRGGFILVLGTTLGTRYGTYHLAQQVSAYRSSIESREGRRRKEGGNRLTYPRQDVPPTMALEDDSPRQLHPATRGDEVVAEYIVHVPDEEAGQESEDPCSVDMSVLSSLSSPDSIPWATNQSRPGATS